MSQREVIKRALLEIRELRERVARNEGAQHESVAIVGIGCRLPGGVSSPDGVWEMLVQGEDVTREIPGERWDVDAYYDPDPNVPGKMMTKRGGFLDEVDLFDPLFFGIPPREAASMDPQHRLFLEVAWEALENAGIAPDRLRGTRTGVFLGITAYDYAQRILQHVRPEAMDAYMSTGNPLNFAAGRLSYLLGLQGPSLVTDTACSSSLVSLHLAVQHLRLGLCDAAIAGGVNMVLLPETMVALSQARMLAADGRCKTFDAAADGYGRGEGAGALVLKRLSDAVREGDQVWAVIRGTAVNHNGPSSGLTVPSAQAQRALIQEALRDARLEAHQVGAVEAHGTGTSLGDPIELRALQEAYGQRDEPLRVASIKTNVGHLEAASGVAGVIKMALMLHHRTLVPHLHLREPNPRVNWEALNLRVPVTVEPLTATVARGAVSGFGVSGTNAHVILEEAPPLDGPEVVERPAVVTLSAPSAASLPRLAGDIAHALDVKAMALNDVAATLNRGRARFAHRLAVVVADVGELQTRLKDIAQRDDISHSQPQAAGRARVLRGDVSGKRRPPLAFIFSGSGAQTLNMGSDLYKSNATYRQHFDVCAEKMNAYLVRPLGEVLFGENEAALHDTAFMQASLFAVEYALAKLWQSWGIQPDMLLGHSIGEVVAACIGGALTLDEAVHLTVGRAQIVSERTPPGQMVTAFADAATVEQALHGYENSVSIAAYNGTDLTVFGGDEAGVAAVSQRLQEMGASLQPLAVGHGFHSPLMDPVLDDIRDLTAGFAQRRMQRPIADNLSGQLQARFAFPADYWARQTREPVAFVQGIRSLYEGGARVFLEIGPKPTLISLGRRYLEKEVGHEAGADEVRWLSSLNEGWREHRLGEAWATLLYSLGALATLGYPVDWDAVDGPYQRVKVRLPNTPYQRERYWHPEGEPKTNGRSAQRGARTVGAHHPLLGQRLASPLAARQWVNTLKRASTSLIDEHIIHGLELMPGIVWIQMGIEAMGGFDAALPFRLEGFTVRQPLIFAHGESYEAQMVLTPESEQVGQFDVYTLEGEDQWAHNTTMRLRLQAEDLRHAIPLAEAVAVLQARCETVLSSDDFYRDVWHPDFHLGASFRCVERVWRRDGEALARIRLPEDDPARHLRPEMLLLDACVQIIMAALPDEVRAGEVFIGLGQEATEVYRAFPARVWCQAVVRENLTPEVRSITGDLTIFDDEGHTLAVFKGVRYARGSRESLQRSARAVQPQASGSSAVREAVKALPENEQGPYLRAHLREVLALVLGTPVERVPMGEALVDVLDSLMSLEVKTRLEGDLRLTVSLDWLLGGLSADELSEGLLAQIVKGTEEMPAVKSTNGHRDLEAASASHGMDVAALQARAHLPEEVRPGRERVVSGEPGLILLTGATGFVGAYLLAELLAQTQADVVCLVRADDEQAGLRRIRENLAQYDLWDEGCAGRVRPVVGDLSQPKLGLTHEVYEALARQVDLIWHNGALVKWTYPYAALEGANVQGTVEMLRLATRYGAIPVHLVSTVGVFASTAMAETVITEATPLTATGPLQVGYAQSKWVAEALLHQAGERGLPVSAYRINTGGDSETGAFNRNDYLPLLIKGCVELGAAPEDLALNIQAAPIDHVAWAMAYLSLEGAPGTYHLVNPRPMAWRDAVAVLRSHGYAIGFLPYSAWRERARSRAREDRGFALAGLMPLFDELFPTQTYLPHFEAAQTEAALRGTGYACPPLDGALLGRTLAYLIRSGYLPPPG